MRRQRNSLLKVKVREYKIWTAVNVAAAGNATADARSLNPKSAIGKLTADMMAYNAVPKGFWVPWAIPERSAKESDKEDYMKGRKDLWGHTDLKPSSDSSASKLCNLGPVISTLRRIGFIIVVKTHKHDIIYNERVRHKRVQRVGFHSNDAQNRKKWIHWDRYQISGCLGGGYGLIKERSEGVLWAYWNVLYFKCSG